MNSWSWQVTPKPSPFPKLTCNTFPLAPTPTGWFETAAWRLYLRYYYWGPGHTGAIHSLVWDDFRRCESNRGPSHGWPRRELGHQSQSIPDADSVIIILIVNVTNAKAYRAV